MQGGSPAPSAGAAEVETGLDAALRVVRPAHADVSAALARSRVTAALFGAADPVRIGRYTIESEVGAGGGGVVFVARDPELSRRVALKLLSGGGRRDRMLAEGHALARLSHPNVVPVFDAGVHGDQVYVVMELVDGETLRAYCAAPRKVRDIIRVYRQAGEGLAAAHRAGFIHRDFKPDNALVGRDGRVRVVDFGLAHDGGGREAPEGTAATTRAGLGTPRYMAPEQADGATLTAAVDQYAFCVSLREAVLQAVPALPRWLEAIVRRGLATSPRDRFASFDELLAALSRDPATRRRTRVLAASMLGLAAVAFVAGRGDRADGPSCDAGAAELAPIWNDAIRARTSAQLASRGGPYAQRVAPRIVARLDAFAERWRDGHRAACIAHRSGTQSVALFDRRVACLARAKAAFASAARVALAPDAGLAATIAAIGELPDLQRCADPEVLVAAVAPPPSASAAAVGAVADELAALEVEVRAARPGVRDRIAAAVERARALRYPPLVARALRLAGVAAIAGEARAEAIAPLTEATAIALTVGDAALAVEAFARRMWAEGLSEPDRALAGVELVAAMGAGLPASERATRALFDNNLGSVELAAGRRDRARAAFLRALDEARRVTGPASIELAAVRSNLALVTDDPAARAALLDERISIVTEAFSEDHPAVLDTRVRAALLEPHRDHAERALAAACGAYLWLHPDRRAEILECQLELALFALEREDAAAARAAFEHVVASRRPGEDVLRVVLARAHLDALAGDRAAAVAKLDEIRARIDPASARWWVAVIGADATLLRGTIARAQGRAADARAAFEAACATLEAVVAIQRSPMYARRLARARTELVRAWAPAPLPATVAAHADAAAAWYRAAGGYDDVIAELARARRATGSR